MMRVLMISAAGEMGGAERSLYELAVALQRERIEAHVCAPPDSPLAKLCAAAGIPAHPILIERPRYTLNPFELAAHLRALKASSAVVMDISQRINADIFHANTDPAAMVAWWAGHHAGHPFIWHCRDMRERGRLWTPVNRSAACVVAISRAVAEDLQCQGVQPEKIKTVLNGIDLSRFDFPNRAAIRAHARKGLGIGAEQPVILSAGAFVPWKRHELFLQTLDTLRRLPGSAGILPATVAGGTPALPGIGLLAGSDLFHQNTEYAAFLRDEAGRLGFNESALRLLGQRDDMPELLAAADIFVSCSENEPFGRVLAEAAAAGVPVVATRSGAKGEIVEESVTGFLTEANAGAVAAACAKLLQNPPLRAQMGAQAREHAKRLFDIHRAAAEMTDLYERSKK